MEVLTHIQIGAFVTNIHVKLTDADGMSWEECSTYNGETGGGHRSRACTPRSTYVVIYSMNFRGNGPLQTDLGWRSIWSAR